MTGRSSRLEANVLLFGLVKEPGNDSLNGAADVQLLTPEQWEAYRENDDEDLRLAAACVRAEFERRSRQWLALEFLGYVMNAPDNASTPPGCQSDGHAAGAMAGVRMVSVPRSIAIEVAEQALGWDHKLPLEG